MRPRFKVFEVMAYSLLAIAVVYWVASTPV